MKGVGRFSEVSGKDPGDHQEDHLQAPVPSDHRRHLRQRQPRGSGIKPSATTPTSQQHLGGDHSAASPSAATTIPLAAATVATRPSPRANSHGRPMDDADDAGPRDPDLGGQEGKIQPDFVAIGCVGVRKRRKSFASKDSKQLDTVRTFVTLQPFAVSALGSGGSLPVVR